MSERHDAPSGAPAASTPQCSRAGCRAGAVWRVEWRNPKIHALDRRKEWVACDDHRDFLRGYLAARDFPVSVSLLSSDAPSTPLGEPA